MITVYKYKLTPGPGTEEIVMPASAQILSIDAQNGRPCIWAKVDTDYAPERRLVNKLATGVPIDYHELDGMHFLGTVQLLLGNLVLHVYINTPMHEQGREPVAAGDTSVLRVLQRINDFAVELPSQDDMERFRHDVLYIVAQLRSSGILG